MGWRVVGWRVVGWRVVGWRVVGWRVTGQWRDVVHLVAHRHPDRGKGHRDQAHDARGDPQKGQATILLVGVIVVAMVLVVALAWVGEAIAHRANARTAADAVALATASDPEQGEALAAWYRARGLRVEQRGDQTYTASGPSQAASWAAVSAEQHPGAPALRAIVARAEQLLGTPLRSVQWRTESFELSAADAADFATVAGEFSICATPRVTPRVGYETFTWC